MSSINVRYRDNGASMIGGCGCLVWLTLLIFNLTLGAMSVNYILAVWFSKDIPWYGDMIVGLFVAEVSVPAAIITWLLRFFGAI